MMRSAKVLTYAKIKPAHKETKLSETTPRNSIIPLLWKYYA